VKRVGIPFKGKLVKHDKGDGHLYPWIAIRLNESHEVFKVLRDVGFFGRDVEGYLILPEDTLKEVLGEDLYRELLELNDDSGDSGSLTAPAPQRDTRGARDTRGVRGVSL